MPLAKVDKTRKRPVSIDSGGRARVEKCRSVWMCPIRMERIMLGRRAEVQVDLDWIGRQPADAAGRRLWPLLVTLTASQRQDRLTSPGHAAAKKGLHASRPWKALVPSLLLTGKGNAFSITVSEVTIGARRRSWGRSEFLD